MPINPAFVGRTYSSARPYQVGREAVREFATAISATHPFHHDLASARAAGYPDLVAPPTFPVVITLASQEDLAGDSELGLDWTAVVHGDQRFTYHRAIVAGDELTYTLVIDSIRSTVAGDMITTRTELLDSGGGAVVTAISMLVARSVPGTGAAGVSA